MIIFLIRKLIIFDQNLIRPRSDLSQVQAVAWTWSELRLMICPLR